MTDTDPTTPTDPDVDPEAVPLTEEPPGPSPEFPGPGGATVPEEEVPPEGGGDA